MLNSEEIEDEVSMSTEANKQISETELYFGHLSINTSLHHHHGQVYSTEGRARMVLVLSGKFMQMGSKR